MRQNLFFDLYICPFFQHKKTPGSRTEYSFRRTGRLCGHIISFYKDVQAPFHLTISQRQIPGYLKAVPPITDTLPYCSNFVLIHLSLSSQIPRFRLFIAVIRLTTPPFYTLHPFLSTFFSRFFHKIARLFSTLMSNKKD